MDEFTLNYRMDTNDILAYKFGYHRTSHIAFYFRKPVAIISFVLLAAYFIYTHVGKDLNFTSGMTILGVFFYFLFLLSYRFQTVFRIIFWHRFKGSAKHNVGEIELRLEDRNIFFKSHQFEGYCKWSDVTFYIDDEKHFFLYHHEDSGVIIPKRIFLLAQEEHDVKAFIERKLSEHKTN